MVNMSRDKKNGTDIRFVFSFVLLFLLLVVFSVWNLFIGSISISAGDVFKILFEGRTGTPVSRIIWEIRLPRLIAAALLGGALSVSGFLLQTFFGNPIAGPFVLGISSGAKLFVAAVLIFFLKLGISVNSFIMVAAAFTGSMAAMGIVLIFSMRVRNMSVLVVCGILVGYICTAATDFFITFASDANIVNLHNWSMGSFSGTSWNEVKIIAVIVPVVFFITFLMSKPISAYQLGENYAKNMGVNIKALRITLILFSSILSACVTAFAGPVSFVGIAVPHLVRSATKTSKPLILIPGCFLGGAAVTVLCDGLARWIFAPTELSISTVTAFLLVPVVIYMMLKRNKDY